MTGDLLNKYDYEVIDGIGDSDHCPMITKISLPHKKISKRQTRWNFQKASWEIYKETSNKLLSEIDMTEMTQEKSMKLSLFLYLGQLLYLSPKVADKSSNPFGMMSLKLQSMQEKKLEVEKKKIPPSLTE